MGRRNRIHPYADLPASFHYLGNQRGVFFGCARASVSVKETFDVGFDSVTWTTSNVKELPTELHRGKRSIDYPARGNPYNTAQKNRILNHCSVAVVLVPGMSHHRHDTSYRIVQLEHSLCTCVDLGIAGRSTFPETNIRVQDKKNGDQNTSECRLDLQRSRIGFKVSTRESTHRPAVLHTTLYLNIGIISILISFTNVTYI